MRILLAAKHAPHGSRPIGGVQSWCRTVAAELDRRGHESYTWGPEQPAPLGGFDLGVIANASDTARAFAWCRKTINVSHGIIEAERPSPDHPTAFTSEEIRDRWKADGIIVRQPIDLDFWSPLMRHGRSLNLAINLTRFSYRGGLAWIKLLAHQLQYSYQHIRSATPELARDVLRKSACVLASGRAALEAMACGVPVVICDHRAAYQGPLFDSDTTGAMVRNYSGRGGVEPTPEIVEEAIKNAIEKGSLRDHIQANHDVKIVVDQLLEAI